MLGSRSFLEMHFTHPDHNKLNADLSWKATLLVMLW